MEITAATMVQRIGDAGNLVDYVDVAFTTSGGQGAGTVEVPMLPGWQDAAIAAATERAAEIDALFAAAQ